eukprot:gene15301-16878_t
MDCHVKEKRGYNARAIAIRCISLLGLITLVGWEVWKAGDMLTTIRDQLSNTELQKQYAKVSEEMKKNDQLMSTVNDIENAMIQRTRKQALVSHCHKRNRSDIYPAGQSPKTGLNRDAFKNILVSDKNQLLYCMIPKVACTNWRRVLMVLEGYSDDPLSLNANDVHNYTYGLLRPLSDYTTDEIVFRLSTYYKFVFVRNPLERFTSAYRTKFVEARGKSLFKGTVGKYIIRKYRSGVTESEAEDGENVTFREFVNYVIDSPLEDPGFYDRHWERYDRLCLPCMIYYDFIGKFETLADDSDYLLRLIDVKSKVSFPELKSKYQVPAKALSNIYYQSLGTDLQNKLIKLYEKDFEMFGYKTPQKANDKNKGHRK